MGRMQVAIIPARGGPMSTDAIVVLKDDHKKIRKLFKEFQAAGDDATAKKGKLARSIIEELTAHTYLENEVMYPETRALLPELEDDVLESYEEHHVADVLCMELATMKPTDERFDAKMTVLIENVSHHMDEEEQDWFPKVRAGLGRKKLAAIGQRMLDLKPQAPRRPTQPSALKKAIDALTA
jgi:hemerythrin superfamily protein